LSEFKEDTGNKKGPLKHSKDAAFKNSLAPTASGVKGSKANED